MFERRGSVHIQGSLRACSGKVTTQLSEHVIAICVRSSYMSVLLYSTIWYSVYQIPDRNITHLGLSENQGTLSWGPYNKDPLFRVLYEGPLFSETPFNAPRLKVLAMVKLWG